MSIIRLRNVTKRYDDKLVLREINLKLDPGDRVGLLGKNGSGKTTLLRLILSQEAPDEGAVEVDAGVRIGYFSQFSELSEDVSIAEVLNQVFAPIHAIEAELAEINEALQEQEAPDGVATSGEAPGGATTNEEAPGGAFPFVVSPVRGVLRQLLERQAALMAEMDSFGTNARDGWNYAYRIDTVLTRLGFAEEDRSKPVGQLSGGWRNRAALAKILLEQPDVLLLDEPTNFLDLQGLTWLEEWLQEFRGGMLVVSHDRDFIDHVATRMVEIDNYHLQEYSGNFAAYVAQKRTRTRMLERQFEHEEELLILESEAILDRREIRKDPRKAMQRKLADIKKRVEPRPIDRVITVLYDHLRPPDLLCRTERLGKIYGDRVLFSDLTFDLHRGERVAIVGPNGCGKTTLLRTLSLAIEPDEGSITWPKRADFAYYNDLMDALDPKDTVSHAVNVVGIAYIAPRRQVNHFLELLQFSEMDLRQPIGTLSGGQRARVALAQALLSGAGTVLLDEPTNHLDLQSIQVMERALVNFPGAIVVISHDRFFIDKVATRMFLFEDPGHVREFNGNWSLYQATLEQS
jgi:ATP-binding cassette subfamily F protein 3